MVDNAYTTSTLGTAQDTTSYLYGDTSWGDLLTSYDGTAITHDGIGNPLNDGTWTYTWEHGRELMSMYGEDIGGGTNDVTIEYVYDSDGMRIGKTVTTRNYTQHTHEYEITSQVEPTCTTSGYTLYACDCGERYKGNITAPLGHDYSLGEGLVGQTCRRCGAGIIIGPIKPDPGIGELQSASLDENLVLESTVVEEYTYVYTGGKLMQMTITTTVDGGSPTAETLNFTYDASGVPMSVTYGDAAYYYATNIQGDVMAILNTSGSAVVEYTYDAWGNIHSTTGTLAETLGEVNPLTYRGYVYDRESNFYYLQSRYYDPEVGRFINADAFASTGCGLLGCNTISYCNNNPVLFADSSGMAPWPTTVVINDGASAEVEIPPVPPGVRDVTDEVLAALLDAAARAKTLKTGLDYQYPDNLIHPDIYLEFYNLVNHEMPWDIKLELPWTITIGTPFPGYEVVVLFNGDLMTPEMLGNYTYGYLGYAYGIPLPILFAGSYYAAGFPVSGFELENEIWDWGYIKKGYYDAKYGTLEGGWM